MTNQYNAINDIICYLCDSVDTYENLKRNYDTITHSTENSNRCYNYILCFERVVLEFNEYYKKYDNVTITEYMNCESAIWHLQRFVGSEIDSIISYGFHYVMRDSKNLRYQYKCYCLIYDMIVSICKKHNVYC